MMPNPGSRHVTAGPRGALAPLIVLIALLWLSYLAVPTQVALKLPVVLLALCGFGVHRLIRRDPNAVWNPMTWFLIAAAIYYGLGPLIYLSSDDVILGYIHGYYFVDDEALVRTNVLNAVSIMLICAVYETALHLAPKSTGRRPLTAPEVERNSGTLLILFAVVGYAATLLVYLTKASLGQDVVMFGIFFSLRELTKAALLLAAYGYASGYRRTLAPFVLLAVVELFVAVGTLMKQNVLEVLFVTFLGVFLARPSRKLFVLAAPLAIVAYLAMAPVFSAARDAVWSTGDTSATAGVTGVLGELGGNGSNTGEMDSTNGWWSRLSQSPAQAFAMDAHDMGQPGHTFELALFTFVPRLIWPNKPIITFGSEFTFLVKGDTVGGASGSGYFAEAYWNFGWLGVGIMALVTGSVYAFFSRQNATKLQERDFRWVPIAYLSLKMGYRPDDWFVANIIGTIPIIASIWLLISVSFALVRRVRRDSPAQNSSGAVANRVLPRPV